MENSGRDIVMANELFVAAVKGIIEVITNSESSDEYLLSKTHQKNNIVHVALQNKRFSFADEALKRLPDLLYEENADGNNPLHIAAEVGDTDFVRQLCERTTDMKPLRMQNSDGNTPLHVAIIYANLDIAKIIVENDPGVAAVVNGSMEAPLHLLIKHFAAADECSIISIKDKMRRVQDGKPDWGMSYSVVSREGMFSLITLILQKESNVACWRDASGLTPLHRAALLNTAYCLQVIGLILSHCPASVEVRDIFRKTILHHLINRIPSSQDGLDLLEKYPFIIYALKNFQDQHGDTPLHLAIINKDFVMVRLLMDAEANLNIKNRDGLSAANLIQQSNILDDTTNPWREPTVRKDVLVDLQKSNYMLNDQHFLSLGKTNNQNNVVHVALEYGNIGFSLRALRRFPHLMWERNLDGNTPIHIAAEIGRPAFMKKYCDELADTSSLRLKNLEGNTPLHVALLHHKLGTARILLEKDPALTDIVNGSMEAPFHLIFHNYHDDNSNNIKRVKEMIQQMIDGKYEDALDDYENDDQTSTLSISRMMILMSKDSPKCSKMVRMINLLSMKASYVACWHDASGLTPLHKAASVDTSYNLDIIRLIISRCPQSIEERDGFGRTILHHLINRMDNSEYSRSFSKIQQDMKQMRHIYNYQDQEGNTPLHLAVIKRDYVMWELLTLDCPTNVFIKNKEGLSAHTLIKQSEAWLEDERKALGRRNVMTEEECNALYFRERFKSAEESSIALTSQDSEGRNLMHKLFSIKSIQRRFIIPDQFLDFIKHIKHDCVLTGVLSQADRNGDTPFHILARLEPDNIKIYMADRRLTEKKSVPLLSSYAGYTVKPYLEYEYELKYLGETPFVEDLIKLFDGVIIEYYHERHLPWFKQNDKGNTPLHEAIAAKNFHVIPKMAEFTRNKTASINNSKETVCHLLASLTPFPPIADDVLDDIIKNNTTDKSHFCDVDGLSPLIRAIRADNVKFAERLCSICPELAKVADPNGQTFWHLLVNVPSESVDFEKGSFNDSGEIVWSQLKNKDKDENTPLHLAIKKLRFDLAKAFLSHDVSGTSDRTHKYNTSLLKIENKAGETPGDMIGALPYISPTFEEFIWKDRAMIGTRSMWGIPSTQMKDYVNTMGVIATLLTTITFTAAFTVPGGLDQGKGIPLLISIPAFQVFIISDVLAMCLSMMVLFCLLWIMATGNKSKSVVLLDFSIILLLASFYTTLVTFMTGLYATTYQVKLWVAIVSLVPCSMLLLLMHRYLVIHLVIPAGKGILIIADTVYHFASETFQCARKHLQCALLPFHYANELRKKVLSRIKLCGPRSSAPSPELPMSSTT